MKNFRSKILHLLAAQLCLFVATPSAIHAQTNSRTCTALVQIGNDLWLTQSDGTPINQITNDGDLKYDASISRDGRVISYTGKSYNNRVLLVNPSGQILASIDTQARDANIGLEWMSKDLLRVQEHVSPSSSSYRFIQVPVDNPTKATLLRDPPVEGKSCSKSPKHSIMACTQGDSVDLNERTIYYAPSAFKNSDDLQTITLSSGANITTATIPGFNVEIANVAKDSVLIKITLPDASSQQSYVPYGDVMPILVPTTDPDRNSNVFGFQPLRVSNNHGVVTLKIKKSLTGETVFENGPVWSLDGTKIAVVELDGRNVRTLVILRRKLGDRGEEKENEETDIIIAKTLLPIEGPVKSINFTSKDTIQVEGKEQIYQATIPNHGKGRGNWPYTLIPALPDQLMVNINNTALLANVKDWSCK